MIPKFRAWDVHNKEMFANDQLIIWDSNVYANDPGKISVDKMRGWSIDEKYLMQSTGLFDKNGVEIFEGDVLKGDDGEIFLNTVYFDEKTAKWMRDTDIELWENVELLEIIGNIYENPELVEEVLND